VRSLRHEQFWTSAEVRAELASPGVTPDAAELVVTWCAVVEQLG